MLIKNKNSFILYIAGLTVALVLLNLISRDNFFRFDLTDNKKFSLSQSSEAIISKLDDRLTIKVYFSDDLPSELGNTRRFLQDILEEYQALANDVSFFFHDPESDTELEEQARKDGIQPVQMQALENDQMVVKKVYLGMVLLFENKKEIIPLIQSTAGLEYMISTKIKSLINLNKKTIGLMHLSIDDKPKQWLSKEGFDPIYGARPLKRLIQKTLYNAIANELLEGKNQEMSHMKVSLSEDQFELVTEQ